jgi:hypothetical protein
VAFAGLFDVLDFSNAFAGFDLAGIAPGAAASVTETFTTGFTADTYYSFGSTAENATPHWCEFMHDGETGTEINGNVTLQFVDGQRGDSDLEVNAPSWTRWRLRIRPTFPVPVAAWAGAV